MKVDYNTKNWPYIRITFLNKDVNEEGFIEHLNNFKNLYKLCEEQKGKMVIIFDLREVPAGAIKYIRRQSNFNTEIKPLSLKYLEHSLFLTSKIGKKLLDLIFAIEKPVANYDTFYSDEALIKFLKENKELWNKKLYSNPTQVCT